MAVVRSAVEVAERCLALRGVLEAVCGRPKQEVAAWLRAESLWVVTSPEEKRFRKAKKEDKAAQTQMSWRSEALGTLLWALGVLKGMPPYNKSVDSRKAAKVFPGVGEPTASFREKAKLRRKREIEQACESVYEAAWKINDAGLRRRQVPVRLNPDIVMERHHALNWLCGFGGDEWDEIERDT